MLRPFFVLLQSHFVPNSMMKKGRKKAKIVDYDLDAKMSPTPRVEIIYEDTKLVTGDELKFKWGQIYHMFMDNKVPEVGLEDLSLYDNILRYGITKVSLDKRFFLALRSLDGFCPKKMQQG